MTDLFGYAPPPAVAFVIAWLYPLENDPDKVGSKRWAAGMPFPYRMVTRVTGRMTADADYPVIQVHTFAATETEAQREGINTDRRMLLLADNPSLDIAMPGLANCDWLEVSEAAHEEPYAASSVVTLLVSEYRLGLSFVAV